MKTRIAHEVIVEVAPSFRLTVTAPPSVLDLNIGLFCVALRADRDVLAYGHQHRAGDETGHTVTLSR